MKKIILGLVILSFSMLLSINFNNLTSSDNKLSNLTLESLIKSAYAQSEQCVELGDNCYDGADEVPSVMPIPGTDCYAVTVYCYPGTGNNCREFTRIQCEPIW